MLGNTLTRRLITVPAVLILFAVTTLTLPVAIAVALFVDVWRWVRRRRRWMTLRMLAFFWSYLAGEVWAVLSLGVLALVGRERSMESTFVLQQAWATWNLNLVRTLIQLDISVTGSESIAPGPVVVLSRHCSLIDTLLPAALITREAGIRLRYVLKKELLIDPALDIAGNRLPNFFVDRGSSGSERERAAIRALASDLPEDEGILIYPEGTRFSEAKRRRLLEKSREGDPVRSLHHLLPPRPGGTLAILDVSDADILVLGHTGLEGFATVKEIWGGNLVGSTVRVSFRRIPFGSIPADRAGRLNWLRGVWEDLDTWVGQSHSVEP